MSGFSYVLFIFFLLLLLFLFLLHFLIFVLFCVLLLLVLLHLSSVFFLISLVFCYITAFFLTSLPLLSHSTLLLFSLLMFYSLSSFIGQSHALFSTFFTVIIFASFLHLPAVIIHPHLSLHYLCSLPPPLRRLPHEPLPNRCLIKPSLRPDSLLHLSASDRCPWGPGDTHTLSRYTVSSHNHILTFCYKFNTKEVWCTLQIDVHLVFLDSRF